MSDFTSTDIQAVMAGTADRRTTMAVLTSTTCGEPCWHARLRGELYARLGYTITR